MYGTARAPEGPGPLSAGRTSVSYQAVSSTEDEYVDIVHTTAEYTSVSDAAAASES